MIFFISSTPEFLNSARAAGGARRLRGIGC
jgi:hypothetical protein